MLGTKLVLATSQRLVNHAGGWETCFTQQPKNKYVCNMYVWIFYFLPLAG